MADILALTESEMIPFSQNYAVKLRSQRASENTWTEIGQDMNPPFIDNRPPLVSGPPEERQYQAAYVDNDVVTTDWSATLTVVAHS